MEHQLKLRVLSSLVKIFADECPHESDITRIAGFRDEALSFQIGYYMETPYRLFNCEVRVESELSFRLYTVELVKSDMPVYADHDDYLLRTAPGLYPDLLRPYNGSVPMPAQQWRSVWFELAEPRAAGTYPVTVSFVLDDEVMQTATLEVEILAADLPQNDLIYTNWFHSDCLSTWYNVPVFSERHWEIVEAFAKTAVEHGQTMLLTPLFTPALDTAVGTERPTVQLVDVTVTDGVYTFGFEKLERWIAMCDRVGVRWFELSHFFTQWGALHAPKVMATVDGVYQRIFGWETDSLGDAYSDFLRAFAAAFTAFASAHGIADRCYLHVSDEPDSESLEVYAAHSALLREIFPGYKIIDALSDPKFYDSGAVPNPVPAIDHIEPFYERNIEGLWGYYCCGQYRNHEPNRFFAMPSLRNRILGVLLYRYRMGGFLQWGYNFWYSRHSLHPINPFTVTDADYAFPSGDAFVVYPGDDGTPICSLRLKVLRECFNDLRALKLLEAHIGREAVLALMEEDCPKLTFNDYPQTETWLFALREKIHAYFR